MIGFLNSKWASALLLVVSFLLIYNPLVSFPYTFVTIIAFVLLATYLQDGNLTALRFRPLGVRELKVILVGYLCLELSIDFIIDPIINRICGESADYSMFSALQGRTGLYLGWLLKMWISAAFGEELLFRAFAFAQLGRVVGNKNYIIVLVSALMFCIPHLYQGIAGLMSTFVFGIAFALIYMRYKNIWINIIIHGLIDSVFLTLSYLGYLEFYTLLW